jgi:hypothetical protein
MAGQAAMGEKQCSEIGGVELKKNTGPEIFFFGKT